MKTKEEIIKKYLDENGEIFVRLTDDRLFKEIFGREENKKYLADFLEAFFLLERGSLLKKLKSGYEVSIDKKFYLEKSGRCDIIAEFDNVITNIEMYSAFNGASKKKSEFYIVAIMTNQFYVGMDYDKGKEFVQVNLIKHDNMGITKTFQEINDIKVHYIVIDKTLKTIYDKDSRFSKYLKLFLAESYQERDNIAKGDELLMELNKEIKSYCNNERFRELLSDEYWDREIYKEEGRILGVQEGKTLGMQEGKTLGIQEGKILGIQEGKILGIQEGKILGIEEGKVEIARNLINLKADKEMIAQATGLSYKDIEKIKYDLER